jgi:Xaa-Pro dipeptidase
MIFEGVLEAVRAVFAELKPGCDWAAMHRLSWRVVIEHLVAAGILIGSVDAMLEAGIGPVFLPCGLGHFIGCDTHDVGGYNEGYRPPRIQERGIDKLRTATILEPGMVLTVEPGIYFIDNSLDAALADVTQAPFFNRERLEQFRGFGGVRLEDVVVITEDGFDNYTLCPRTCDEIEAVMAGGEWPPATDAAPWLRRKWGDRSEL